VEKESIKAVKKNASILTLANKVVFIGFSEKNKTQGKKTINYAQHITERGNHVFRYKVHRFSVGGGNTTHILLTRIARGKRHKNRCKKKGMPQWHALYLPIKP